MSKRVLVTGALGLVGSECARLFAGTGWSVTGSDTGLRAELFGKEWSLGYVFEELKALGPYSHVQVDVRDRLLVGQLFKEGRFDAVIHCAAQPSHELSSMKPGLTWDVNATGTMNMLLAARQYAPEAPFVFMSTNKVYGDAPNDIPMRELDSRYEYEDGAGGVCETFPFDQTLRSPFGASKAAADVMVQEFGRYYGMPTVCFRAGVVTGPQQAGVEMQGFISYLARCVVRERPYKVYGYKGKQVRDVLHVRDLAEAVKRFVDAPRAAAVYNIGGGYRNSVSVLEAIKLLENAADKKLDWRYVDEPRKGDHICYITDYQRLTKDYGWIVRTMLDTIISQVVAAARDPIGERTK